MEKPSTSGTISASPPAHHLAGANHRIHRAVSALDDHLGPRGQDYLQRRWLVEHHHRIHGSQRGQHARAFTLAIVLLHSTTQCTNSSQVTTLSSLCSEISGDSSASNSSASPWTATAISPR